MNLCCGGEQVYAEGVDFFLKNGKNNGEITEIIGSSQPEGVLGKQSKKSGWWKNEVLQMRMERKLVKM